MSLYSDYKNWQLRLQELIAEGDELGRRIEEIEAQYTALLHSSGEREGRSGFKVLTGLYNEGFHICATNFGHPREDDCIFCLNFLLNKGQS